MKITIISKDGKNGKEIELPKLFETKINEHLLYEAVKCYLANQRQGNSQTKTRAEVSGGGRKPWKQKGTGRARAGSNTSPVWKRGSKAHGPEPRLYKTNLNRIARRKALHMALSVRASEGGLQVLDALEVATPKTKEIVTVLHNLGADKSKVLLILNVASGNVVRAGRNIMNLKIRPVVDVNVYDVMNANKVIFTENSLNTFCEVVGA